MRDKHFITKAGVSHCGTLVTRDDEVGPTWADVSCLRCLGRPEEAQVRDAFAPALALFIDMLGAADTATYMDVAREKNNVIFARNNLMHIVAKSVPEDVQAARHAARIATVA